MDLLTIKKNIENGVRNVLWIFILNMFFFSEIIIAFILLFQTIRTTSEFQRDMMLMFQNALMYNSADHDV